MTSRWLAALTFIAVSICVTGVLLFGPEFTVNIASEAAGILLSVVVAVAIVDKLSERRRRTEWSKIRQVTLGSIARRLEGLELEADVHLLVDARDADLASKLRKVAEKIHHDRDALASNTNLDRASSKDLHNGIRNDLSYITDVLVPRVLQFADNIRLSERLVALEVAERAWADNIKTIDDDWGLPETFAWETAENFFRSAADVAEIIEAQYAQETTADPPSRPD